MKTRWGILSTARIGREKVIPAIQNAKNCEVVAIASRVYERAEKTAKNLGIPKVYEGYENLLNDPDIDIVYNPLPNHLHVPCTIKALEAGKHVLCEKPIGMNLRETRILKDEMAKHPELKVMEAFMYRFHPQWQKVKQIIDEGFIGEVKHLNSFFSYYNDDPEDIRNRSNIGGGALMDIGCYCISFPRFIFNKEPKRVVGIIDYDNKMHTDKLTSAMLDFGKGQTATFTCSTQLMYNQRAEISGTEGRIVVEIPVNAPADKPAMVLLQTPVRNEEILCGPANQYTIQAELFAQSVIENTPVPTPFSDAIGNMKTIDAIFDSVEKKGWIDID
jgi:predicted dehydrogenase